MATAAYGGVNEDRGQRGFGNVSCFLLQQQNPAGPPGANPGAEDATNAHPTHNHNPAGGVSAGANNQQATTAAASINSNAQQQQQQQQQQQNPTTNTSLGDEFTNLKKKPKLMEKCPSNPLPDHTTVTTAAAPSSEASTSKQKSNFEMFLSRPMDTTAHEHRKKALKKRPSLPIEPRTTQYQKHALLQVSLFAFLTFETQGVHQWASSKSRGK